jgi:hypothetical protein
MEKKITKKITSTTNARTVPHGNKNRGMRTVRAVRTVTVTTTTVSEPVVVVVKKDKI